MLDFCQQCPFVGILQTVEYLHGNHGCKNRRCRQVCQRMSARRTDDKVEAIYQCTYHHHFAGNVFQGHTEQGCVVFLEAQKRAGKAGAGHHTLFLYPHGFGSTGGTGGVDQHLFGCRKPFGQKVGQGSLKTVLAVLLVKGGLQSAWFVTTGTGIFCRIADAVYG